jgi:hypothetical protein
MAKTHEVGGDAQEFDDQMLNHDPAITRAPESPRADEEKKNVTIDNAVIYGIYRENDNDQDNRVDLFRRGPQGRDRRVSGIQAEDSMGDTSRDGYRVPG